MLDPISSKTPITSTFLLFTMISDPIAVTSDQVKITNLVFTNLTDASKRSHIRFEFTAEYINDADTSYQYSQSFQTSVSLRK